jgi:hypothetical protein
MSTEAAPPLSTAERIKFDAACERGITLEEVKAFTGFTDVGAALELARPKPMFEKFDAPVYTYQPYPKQVKAADGTLSIVNSKDEHDAWEEAQTALIPAEAPASAPAPTPAASTRR